MAERRRELAELWRQVNREVHERFKQVFRGSELPPNSFFMLRHLSEEPGVTVSELARRTGVVKSHISKTVDLMVSQGLVEKRPDPDDQRLIRLFLTPDAAKRSKELESKAMGMWAEVMAEITDDEQDVIAQSLQIMLAALEKTKGVNKPDL